MNTDTLAAGPAAPDPGAQPDAHAERMDAILASARAAFVEKGFEGASMQDLARHAGMSAGNFYRYFPSKEALVEALIRREIAAREIAFAAIRDAADPLAALEAAIAAQLAPAMCRSEGRLWAEILAAAQRKPAIGRASADLEAMVERCLLAIFARVTGLPEAEARDRHAPVARLVLLMVKGLTMHCAAPHAEDGRLVDLVLQTLHAILGRIAAGAPSREAPARDPAKG